MFSWNRQLEYCHTLRVCSNMKENFKNVLIKFLREFVDLSNWMVNSVLVYKFLVNQFNWLLLGP